MQLHIETMTCGACARHVTQAIRSVDPNAEVSIEIGARRVLVETVAGEEEVRAALAADGYAATVV